MATQGGVQALGSGGPAPAAGQARITLAPEGYDRFLAVAAALLLVAVLAALARGYGEWDHIPAVIWLHLATILVALVLTPVMLLRRRGDRLHRRLGWVWSAALFFTALDSLLIKTINPGHFSFIHLLSLLTLVQVPLIVRAARRHDWKRHRTAVRGMVTGALLVAGFFTFPFGRLLGHWLFG